MRCRIWNCKDNCIFLLEGTDLPPGRIDELINIATIIKSIEKFDFEVQKLQNQTSQDLEKFAYENNPLFLIYD